jgi:hypothetical protein
MKDDPIVYTIPYADVLLWRLIKVFCVFIACIGLLAWIALAWNCIVLTVTLGWSLPGRHPLVDQRTFFVFIVCLPGNFIILRWAGGRGRAIRRRLRARAIEQRFGLR